MKTTKLIWPMDLKAIIEKRERNGFLYEALVSGKPFCLPLTIHPPVKSLVELDTPEKSGLVLRWQKSWKDFQELDVGQVETAMKKVGALRPAPVPVKVVLYRVPKCFSYIDKSNAMNQFLVNYHKLTEVHEALGSWVVEEYKEFNRHCEKIPQYICVAKRIAIPVPESAPYIYKREMDIPGVDTKFLEKNKGIITSMYNALHGTSLKNYVELWKALHITNAPEDVEFVQIRLTDSKYQLLGCETIRVYYPELKTMKIRPQNVFIVENKETFFHFPSVPNSIVIFGHGLSVSGFLKDVPFLREADHIYYWSDLDTDGFRMLSNLRNRYPRTESFLMDMDTVNSSTAFIVEDTGSVWENLPNLTEKEKQCFQYLSSYRLRLEQERISWGYVLGRVKALTRDL